MSQDYKKEAASHIVTASANLIGVCLIIITGLKVGGYAHAAAIDKMTAVASVLFLISGTLSYLSLRRHSSRIMRARDVADYTFLAGLLLLVITMVSISLSFIG